MQHIEHALDMIGRPIVVGDYVVSYNLLYEVLEVESKQMVRVQLLSPSKSSRPSKRKGLEICKVDRDDVLLYALKKYA
jgi:hypothetical protein